MHHSPQPIWRRAGRSGFTITELLISIVVIFILITAAFYVFRATRQAAGRTLTLNALRQIMVGHSGYSSASNGRLLPGYIAPADFQPGGAYESLIVRLRTGKALAPEEKASYVWRLSPYLDHDWQTFMADYRSQALVTRFVNEYGDGGEGGTYINIAQNPSFGLNSLFVGGDSFHAGGSPASVAARVSQVKNPARLIVFGTSAAFVNGAVIDANTRAQLGYCELRPPFADYNASTGTGIGPQWTVNPTTNTAEPINSGSAAGMPIDRHSTTADLVPLAFLDGSVGTENLGRLAVDMSRWAPNALRPD